MNRLAGKVALITGGASGIGAATARLFAQNGAKVVIADVQSSLGDSVAKEASSNSQHPVSFVSCDVTKESDVESAVDAVVSAHGKLDIMYSNAGVTGDSSGHQILTVDAEELRRVLDINVVGGFLCAKHAARVMIPEKKAGTILFTASVVTDTFGLFAHTYTASKHGQVGLVKNLCVELGQYGIRVNAVSPAAVPTPMAMKALGLDRKGVQEFYAQKSALKGPLLDEKDIAEAALYLADGERRLRPGPLILLLLLLFYYYYLLEYSVIIRVIRISLGLGLLLPILFRKYSFTCCFGFGFPCLKGKGVCGTCPINMYLCSSFY
ncbi:unnamed protein product [Linum tenue]|uniref:Ketoreductase domain-containing protein n=1 Tax=Linum tenue TaxID=586396 RepID=A0AAV0N9P3_9ROSI|nr:unnamed protein product [Linum tenue]